MERVTHYSSPEKPWGKSHTPKRYIHPPFSENMVTMWPNTMVMLGETQGGATPQKSAPGRYNQSVLPSCAMIFGRNWKFFDYKNVEYHTRPDGIPIHSISKNLGTFTLHQESFCNTERIPTAYTKLVIHNNTNAVLEDTVSMIARTKDEFDLVGCFEPDGYYEIEPTLYRWMDTPLWEHTDEKITDGKYSVYFRADEKVTIGPKDAYWVHFNFQLAPGEDATIYFAFGRGRITADFSYEDAYKKTEEFWNGELANITVFPNKDNPDFYAMYRSLVAQGLQMFSYPQGVNYTILRQGALQRLLWPTDVRSMIRALARIGHFEKYIDAIFNTYFHVMQSKHGENKGEIVNFGIPWGSVTGSVLFAFGAAATYSKELYDSYKDNAYAAFQWIEKQRQLSTNDPKLAAGFFPPARCSDYPASEQMWGYTDTWNMQGYALYIQGLRAQNDPHLQEVEAAFENYMACAKDLFHRAAEEQKDSDIILVPLDARNDPTIEKKVAGGILNRCFTDYIVLGLGIAGFDTPEANKVLKQYTETGLCENGLTHTFAPSLNCKGGRRWYTSWADSELYFYYRHSGKDALAKEILDAQLNYAMTPEYYISERYDDSDPYYMPWCPNCSGNGRTITMLCDWYIDRK